MTGMPVTVCSTWLHGHAIKLTGIFRRKYRREIASHGLSFPSLPSLYSLSTSNQASRCLSLNETKLPEITAHLRHTVWGNLVKCIHCCCSCAASKDKITTLKQARGPSEGIPLRYLCKCEQRSFVWSPSTRALVVESRSKEARLVGWTSKHILESCAFETGTFVGEITMFSFAKLVFHFAKRMYMYELMEIRFSRFSSLFFFFFFFFW